MSKNEAQKYNGGTRVPKDACVFACPEGAAAFVAGEDTNGRFTLQAYDGGINQHWYWGNFAIDLKGLRFAGKRLPVLDSHWTSDRIGVTTKQEISDKVTAEGRFLSNAKAQELRKDMQDEFPMQSSLSGRPIKIEQVAEGAFAEVNGKRLKGPGAIWREAMIEEISMCVFGAMKNTKSTAFADTDTESIEFELLGDTQMSDKDKPALTAESFAAEQPQRFTPLRDAAYAEGQKAEQSRFAALQKACGDDHALAAECFAANMTVTDALTRRNEKLSAELKAANEKLAAKPTAPAQTLVDKARQEFKAQPPVADAPTAFDEKTATDDQLKERFAATKDIQDRFSCAGSYIESVRHQPKR